MIARIVVQTNRDTGEKHVTFCDDDSAPLQEMLVTSPSWNNSTITEGRVLIFSMDEDSEHLEALMNTELHTAMTEHPVSPLGSRKEAIAQVVRNLLEGNL
jgi:hypothetical protein